MTAQIIPLFKETPRACWNCTNAYEGEHGVYCVVVHELIWDCADAASDCGCFEPRSC
jgi:hypothetical protein